LEEIGEVGLATGELADCGRTIGQRLIARHPVGEAIDIESLVLPDLDGAFHRSKGIRGVYPHASS
jgi:hypothetical protein